MAGEEDLRRCVGVGRSPRCLGRNMSVASVRHSAMTCVGSSMDCTGWNAAQCVVLPTETSRMQFEIGPGLHGSGANSVIPGPSPPESDRMKRIRPRSGHMWPGITHTRDELSSESGHDAGRARSTKFEAICFGVCQSHAMLDHFWLDVGRSGAIPAILVKAPGWARQALPRRSGDPGSRAAGTQLAAPRLASASRKPSLSHFPSVGG